MRGRCAVCQKGSSGSSSGCAWSGMSCSRQACCICGPYVAHSAWRTARRHSATASACSGVQCLDAPRWVTAKSDHGDQAHAAPSSRYGMVPPGGSRVRRAGLHTQRTRHGRRSGADAFIQRCACLTRTWNQAQARGSDLDRHRRPRHKRQSWTCPLANQANIRPGSRPVHVRRLM